MRKRCEVERKSSQSSLGHDKETGGEIVEFLEKVEQSGQVAAASLHNDELPDPEECHE